VIVIQRTQTFDFIVTAKCPFFWPFTSF